VTIGVAQPTRHDLRIAFTSIRSAFSRAGSAYAAVSRSRSRLWPHKFSVRPRADAKKV
jgi:hypothetical protein